jgi:phosphate starvation-inducible PhoH-like protein
MIERIIILENVDPLVFFGINNSNTQLLKTLYPKLRIVARGNVIKVIGDEQELATFEEKIHELEKFSIEMNVLKEEDILDIVKGKAPTIINVDNLIIHGMNGKPILARTANQKKLMEAFDVNDMVFAIGPAGSGKTYTAIALAVRALKSKQVRKIILSRPAVEAGEKLGFLPGDMKEKIDPYLQPLYDALEDMIPPMKLKEYLESKIIQIAPLAFMRGRTLNDAVIILDEAQNTTKAQIKMFLTRLGINGKMIITGDITQIDLPHSQQSGLIHSMRLLQQINGIATVEFNKKDIVRHRLVQRIVEAYEKESDSGQGPSVQRKEEQTEKAERTTLPGSS